MSEAQATRLLRRLGLWARREITLGRDGRVLNGALDPEAECLYVQLYELHDKVLERIALSRVEEAFLAHCQDYIQPFAQQIAQLEREFA